MFNPQSSFSKEIAAKQAEQPTKQQNKTFKTIDQPDHPLLPYVNVKSNTNGKVEITCPFVELHTKHKDTGTVIFLHEGGGFAYCCHHNCCRDRTSKDVLNELEKRHPGFKDEMEVYKLNRLFNDVGDLTGIDPIVKQMNEKHAFIIVGGKSRITQSNEDGEIVFLTHQTFKDLYINKKNNGKSVASIWMESSHRRTYSDGVEFRPHVGKVKNDGKKFNLWSGFGVNQIDYDEQKINILLDYIKDIVCGGNNQYYYYIICWLARGVQYPEKQAEVAIVLRGSKGSGKSTLSKIMARIYGAHSKTISNSKHLTGNFNAHLKDCVFLFTDEAFYVGDKPGEAVLKTLITEPTYIIEPKGIDAFEIRNCLKIIMASNHDWVVPSSADERRFFCLNVECSLSANDKTQYFSNLYSAIDDERGGMFLDYLQNRDLSNFNIRTYPETAANISQKEHSLGVLPRFLLEVCDRGYFVQSNFSDDIWFERVQTELIMEGLRLWGRDHFKHAYERPERKQLCEYLRKISLNSTKLRNVAIINNGSVIVSDKPKNGYLIGSAEELRLRVNEYEKITPEFDFL